jgi:hypothetical protein
VWTSSRRRSSSVVLRHGPFMMLPLDVARAHAAAVVEALPVGDPLDLDESTIERVLTVLRRVLPNVSHDESLHLTNAAIESARALARHDWMLLGENRSETPATSRKHLRLGLIVHLHESSDGEVGVVMQKQSMAWSRAYSGHGRAKPDAKDLAAVAALARERIEVVVKSAEGYE